MKEEENGFGEVKAIFRLRDRCFSKVIPNPTSNLAIRRKDSHRVVFSGKGSKAFLQGSACI